MAENMNVSLWSIIEQVVLGFNSSLIRSTLSFWISNKDSFFKLSHGMPSTSCKNYQTKAIPIDPASANPPLTPVSNLSMLEEWHFWQALSMQSLPAHIEHYSKAIAENQWARKVIEDLSQSDFKLLMMYWKTWTRLFPKTENLSAISKWCKICILDVIDSTQSIQMNVSWQAGDDRTPTGFTLLILDQNQHRPSWR